MFLTPLAPHVQEMHTPSLIDPGIAINENDIEIEDIGHDLKYMPNPDKKCRILVADDQRFNIIAIRFHMQKDFGFDENDVIYVHDGAAAVKAYKESLAQMNESNFVPIRLILTDYIMPFLNGVQVVKSIAKCYNQIKEQDAYNVLEEPVYIM